MVSSDIMSNILLVSTNILEEAPTVGEVSTVLGNNTSLTMASK